MAFKQNLHMHSTYCDGIDAPESTIKRAIELGFDAIGFSGHSYMYYSQQYSMSKEGTEQYKKEVRELQKKYEGKIDVYLGLEFDMYSEVDLSGYDYLIGGTHYLYVNGEHVGFDRSAEVVKGVIDKHFGGDGLKFAKAYYETLARLPEYGKFDIVAHFDLITKNCEKANLFDTDCKKYKDYALTVLHALCEKIKIFEVNTGAIARGYRTTPYPMPFILKELKNIGGQVTISSDCHDNRFIDCHFKQTEEYIKSCGFDKVTVLHKGEFKEIKI